MKDPLPSVIDFCNMTLNVNGVLNDQVTTYTNTKKEMQQHLAVAGDQMMNALGLNANITVSTPLE